MKEFLFSWFTNLGQKLAVLLLVGTTAVTTGSAVTKIATASKVLGVKVETEGRVEQKTTPVSPTPVAAGSRPNPTPTGAAPTTRVTPTASPTVRTSQSVSASVDLSGRCIITLFGKQYDVTTLRSTHSGGDVFSCGSDMTTSYQAKHGTNMSRMAKYEVTGTGQTSVNSGAQVQSGGSEDEEGENEEDDEREDREHEERYIEREEREEVEDED